MPDMSIARQFPNADIGIILGNRDRACVGMDCVFDNGAYTAWKNNIEWNEEAWLKLAKRLSKKARVQWAVVPDVVADCNATLGAWRRWAGVMKFELGFNLAMAVQDGMTPADVPCDTGDSICPDVIFIGGTTDWKWSSLYTWTNAFERVHVGKVNSLRQLTAAHDAGVESIDGTGFTYKENRKYITQYLNRIKTPRML